MPESNPNLYDLLCTLLIEFHEHSLVRVPDLLSSLLAVSVGSMAPGADSTDADAQNLHNM